MKTNKFKGLIFDLDGTLVNSIEDIADSMNTVLKGYGYPTHSYEDYTIFVGSGIRSLVRKSLPESVRDDQSITSCFNEMMKIYSDNCTNKTKPYDGIVDLINSLKSRNLKLSVFSNKADEFTKRIVTHLFPNCFEPIIGLTIETLKKPNPHIAIEISKTFGFNPEEIIFVGDTDIDMQTANNANMHAVGVLWGFRTKDELIANGSKSVLNNPSDLIEILDR